MVIFLRACSDVFISTLWLPDSANVNLNVNHCSNQKVRLDVPLHAMEQFIFARTRQVFNTVDLHFPFMRHVPTKLIKVKPRKAGTLVWRV